MRSFIFDDAGTGKTKRAIDLFAPLRSVLVVCPANVMETSWIPQLKRWDPERGDSVMLLRDMRNLSESAWAHSEFKYLISSYEMLKSLSFVPAHYGMIVDESHFVKNPRSNRSKMVRALSDKADDLLMLTGTPAPKDLEDIFGQCSVMYPHRADRAAKFGREFATLGSFRLAFGKAFSMHINGFDVRKYSYEDDATRVVYDRLSADVLERRESEFTLPEVEWVPCRQNVEGRISEWLESWSLDGEVTGVSASSVANKVGQLDDGFAYRDDGSPYVFDSGKIDGARDVAGEVGNLLIWARFRAVLDELAPFGVSAQHVVHNGVDGGSYVYANPQSMGTGVDGLQKYCADQLWIDLPYTFAEWQQANARLIRRGTRFSKHRILVMDTKWNRKVFDVIEGRRKLDEIIKGEK